jgi:hypothetical protein
LKLGSAALIALVGCLACASLARADAPRARLEWVRPTPSMCPTREVLESEVAALLGHDPFAREGAPDVVLRGAVEERTSAVYARIEAIDADGRSLGVRELTAPEGECASLRRPLALIIGLFLEGDLVAARALESHPVSGWLGGYVGALSGAQPRITAGVGLSALVRVRPRLDLSFLASYWLPVVIETAAGLGARFQGVDATAAVCPRLTPPAWKVGAFLCGGFQLGALLASPRGLDGPALQARLSARALFELKLGGVLARRAALEGSIGGVIALVRPPYSLTHSDGSHLAVHRPDLFGALLRLTLFFELAS